MRQCEVVELIASENFPDERVVKACGSEFMNKYAEGYPEKKSVERFKSIFPDYIHTGNTVKRKPGMEQVDVLVDGEYIDELKSPDKHWVGSSNQNVIDVKASIRENKLVLWKEG